MRDQHKLFLLTIITSLTLLAGCQSAPPRSATIACEKPCDSGKPKIVFASTEHNFGKVAPGAKQTCSFEFINDGSKDLVINKIHASCGCTTTTAANPGQASEIVVAYRTGSNKQKARLPI